MARAPLPEEAGPMRLAATTAGSSEPRAPAEPPPFASLLWLGTKERYWPVAAPARDPFPVAVPWRLAYGPACCRLLVRRTCTPPPRSGAPNGEAIPGPVDAAAEPINRKLLAWEAPEVDCKASPMAVGLTRCTERNGEGFMVLLACTEACWVLQDCGVLLAIPPMLDG